MANVTDPLARAIHGANPQNLVEYITRQKIYDSLYWKEECFGLSASDVATKAAELKAIGGSYGGNNKPTRFLCLVLKLLQIQPEEGIVEEFLQNEDFKYVRALGAFYLRLTGRPAEIYELVEPLYNDFRKLRFREPTGWKITYMDELADELLNSDRYCGIALPHLPKRDVLVSAGYLEERRSALMPLIEEKAGGDPEILLKIMAENGNAAAKVALDERNTRKMEAEKKEAMLKKEREEIYDEGDSSEGYKNRRERDFRDNHYDSRGRGDDYDRHDRRRDRERDDDYYGDSRHYRNHSNDYRDDRYRERSRDRYDSRGYREDRHRHERSRDGRNHSPRSDDEYDRHRSHHRHRDHGDRRDHRKRYDKESKSSKDKKYGSLFKKSSGSMRDDDNSRDKKPGAGGSGNVIEGSEEFWDEQRAKLGLKPLKKD